MTGPGQMDVFPGKGLRPWTIGHHCYDLLPVLKPSPFFLFQNQRLRWRISDFDALLRLLCVIIIRAPIGWYIRSSAALPFPLPQAHWRFSGAQLLYLVL